MKTIRTWDDLPEYGIVPLPDPACALSYRILCDLTAKGKQTLEQALSVKELVLHSPQQPGSPDDPHVASIMLAPGMLTFLALFALLDSQADEVFLTTDQRMTGFHHGDPPAGKLAFEEWYRDEVVRHFASESTAWDRSIHYRYDREHGW